MKILLADDAELIRDRIIEVIQKMGNNHVIEQASNGFEAMELLVSFIPDIIILDIHMPYRNGLQVLEEISNSEIRPIIMIFTNYNYPQYRKKCLGLGADLFFNKSTILFHYLIWRLNFL